MTKKKEKRISRHPSKTRSGGATAFLHRIPIVKPLFEALQCKARLSEDKEVLILEPIQEQLALPLRYREIVGSIIAELDDEQPKYWKPKETEPERTTLENVYTLEPVRKLKKLLKGDVKTTKLTLIVPSEFVNERGKPTTRVHLMPTTPIRYTPRKIRLLGKQSRRLYRLPSELVTEYDIEQAEEKGIMIYRPDIGEVTVKECLRIVNRYERDLKKIAEWLRENREPKREYTVSDVIRMAILDLVRKHRKYGALKENTS